MLRNKTQTCWIYSLYRSWKIAIGPVLIPGPDGQYFTTANLWTWDQKGCVERYINADPKFLMHGFVYSTPPHQMTGAFWAGGKKTSPEVKKGIMTRKIENPIILINHWRWLQVNGTKQQAASCKLQAAS